MDKRLLLLLFLNNKLGCFSLQYFPFCISGSHNNLIELESQGKKMEGGKKRYFSEDTGGIKQQSITDHLDALFISGRI